MIRKEGGEIMMVNFNEISLKKRNQVVIKNDFIIKCILIFQGN